MTTTAAIAELDQDLARAVSFLDDVRSDVGPEAFSFILDTLGAAAESMVDLGGAIEGEHLKAATLAQAVCLAAGLDYYRRSVAEREGMQP